MKVLIAGQGIAGTVLAAVLSEKGAQVTVADVHLPGRASAPAAGLINPVTGKRFVKSWRLEDFYPVASQLYRALQESLGVRIWEPYPIVRMLSTPEEINNWSTRCSHPDYENYLQEAPDAGEWEGLIPAGYHFGLICQAARVNFQVLLPAYRKRIQAEGRLLENFVDYQQVTDLLKHFDRIVFCEGFRATENPYFPGLPWRVAKGEALIIRLSAPKAESIRSMLKKQIILVPLGGGLFWAGGTYQWHYTDLEPTAAEGALLEKHLREMLCVPYEVLEHIAAVRPTVIHRRPLLGQSKHHERVFLFNGLGTKGALLAPFMARHFADNLLNGTPLDAAVDIHAPEN